MHLITYSLLTQKRIQQPAQRLTLAAAVAASLHGLFFLGGWLIIQHTSIPANENRPLVITLDSTPMDGSVQNHSDAADTMNETETGLPAHLPEQTKPDQISQRTTITHNKAAFERQPEPSSEIEEAQSTEDRLSTSVARVTAELTPGVPPSGTSPEPDMSSIVAKEQSQVNGRQKTDEPLLTVSQAHISLSSPIKQVQSELADASPILPKQRRMLEKKIQRWANRLDTTEQVEQNVSWQHKGQTYTAKLTHLPASNNMELDEIKVQVTTIDNGQALSTVMHMKQLAFSNFAQFVHRWDPTVMIHDDKMNGRFHSNTQILLASDRKAHPVFRDKVTTASYRVDFNNTVRRSTRSNIFQGGLETGVKKIPMPRPGLDELAQASHDNSITFDANTRIVFSEKGGFFWLALDDNGLPNYQNLAGNQPTYIIAEPGVTLFISGQILGQIIVYSPQRIVIEDDLLYVHDNLQNSHDVLGIISGKDVIIAGQDTVGEGDLNIDASIYARRRFLVRDYLTRHTGTLKIFGSLSAGSIGATQPRYATSITFDKRLETLRPPGFPVTDRYEISEADWQWDTVQ